MPRVQLHVPFAEHEAVRTSPEVIVFNTGSKKGFSARIDNLELCFPDDTSCEILIWEQMPLYSCQSSVCPIKKDCYYEDDNCPHPNGCPHQHMGEVIGPYTSHSKAKTHSELEEKIRHMFTNKHDGTGHRQHWPDPAASEFAAARWEFKRTG